MVTEDEDTNPPHNEEGTSNIHEKNSEIYSSSSTTDKGDIHNDTSILRLLSETISQQCSVSLNNISVPEFSGLPNEDVHSFLKKFKTSTIGLSVELKCQSLRKALKGTAEIWAKCHIKEDILSANWKTIKNKLISRFSDPDRAQNCRRRLNKMTFKDSESTLLGYTEAFIDCYNRAYPGHKPEDAIHAIELNLPTKIIGHLNQLDHDWNEYTDLSQLYSLIRKLETKILPYETKVETPAPSIVDAVQKMLKEFRDEVVKQKEESQPEVAQIALLDQRNWRNNSSAHQCRLRDDSKRHNNEYHQSGDLSVKKPRLSGDEIDKPGRNKDDKISYLIERYRTKFGNVPGGCFICGQPHWKRHCPLRADLN